MKTFILSSLLVLFGTIAVANVPETEDFRRRGDLLTSAYGHCIGGARCGGFQNQVSVFLGRGQFIDTIEFYADDAVGNKHDGRLNIFVDGNLAARGIDIQQFGSTQSIYVGRFGSRIDFVAASNDEVSIGWIQVHGRRW